MAAGVLGESTEAVRHEREISAQTGCWVVQNPDATSYLSFISAADWTQQCDNRAGFWHTEFQCCSRWAVRSAALTPAPEPVTSCVSARHCWCFSSYLHSTVSSEAGPELLPFPLFSIHVAVLQAFPLGNHLCVENLEGLGSLRQRITSNGVETLPTLPF